MKLNLQKKINGAILISFILITLIFSTIYIPFQNHRMETVIKNMVKALHATVELEKHLLANEIFEKRVRAIKIRLKHMMKAEDLVSISVYDGFGKLLLAEGLNGTINQLPAQIIEKAGKGLVLDRKRINGQNTLSYVQMISVLDEKIGFISIHYSLADVEQDQNMSYLLFGSLLLTNLLVMIFLLSQILSRVIIHPVTILRDGMLRIRKKGPGKLIKIKNRDELGDLAREFNETSIALGRSYRKIEQQGKELQQLSDYMTNIINSMPSVLIGINNQEIVSLWNLEAEKTTGITAKEAKGSRLADVFPLLSGKMDKIQKSLWERTPQKDTKIPVVIDRQDRFSDLTIYPLIADGATGAVIRVDDVTERVRMEEMMIQTEKIMLVGGLAAGMAHEINNPLAGIMQNAQVIKSRLTQEIPANLKAAQECDMTMKDLATYMKKRQIDHMIDQVQESGRNASEIILNMLSFSRKSETKLLPYNVSELLDKTVELASTDYDLKKKYDFRVIKIFKDYDTELPEVHCEGSKIQQVFFNILKNGAQAMAEGKDPNRVPTFFLRTMKAGDMARIEIEDNGPGIPEDIRQKIFEPFFTTKEMGVGTGLGLSVSFFIITENHKGKMHVISEEGKGSNFIIELPIKKP